MNFIIFSFLSRRIYEFAIVSNAGLSLSLIFSSTASEEKKCVCVLLSSHLEVKQLSDENDSDKLTSKLFISQ
jgi:hypothetical protein